MRPRKRFGQHFLVDRMAVAAIVEAIHPQPGDRLVEIGPGTAALTAPLIERVGTMDAVEIDRDLAAGLRRRFGDRLRLHEGDALAFDFAALAGAGEKRLRLVGNLPYNISSPLLLHLRGFTAQVVDQHFMLQKEVVNRIVAEPGGDMRRLTVLLQAWYEVQALFALCGGCQGRRSVAEWQRQFDGLAIGEAVVLPITEEAEGEVRRIHLAPRLTPHARHLAKYIDVPVSESRGFVFWRNGMPTRRRARTLREFVAVLESAAPAALDGHLRRGDFSRWIADVFGDYPLAKIVRRLEGDYVVGTLTDAPAALAQAIRSRYEFVEGLGPAS